MNIIQLTKEHDKYIREAVELLRLTFPQFEGYKGMKLSSNNTALFDRNIFLYFL